MINAAILSIGTEIMKGKIENTNASFISRWLFKLGIMAKYHLSVQDTMADIKKSLEVASSCELVILTGGLGPTDDDITREAVSEFLNKKLVFDENAWKEIELFFKARKFTLHLSDRKQAMIIEGGEAIPNAKGTAPGIFYNNNNQIFFLLPGPPRENRPLLDNFLRAKLVEHGFISDDIYVREIRVYNAGEGQIADMFKELKTSCDVGYYFSQDGYIEIIVSKQGGDEASRKSEVDDLFARISALFSEQKIIYTENSDLSQLFFNLLLKSKTTISFAESITGGGASGALVKIPDASKVFLGGVVAYSNELKKNILGVGEGTLAAYGAVSEECVKEMALGLKKITGADVCVSISGIAGPTGDTKDKPIGLVHFGFLIRGEYFHKKQLFTGDRPRIISRCVNFAFLEIMNKLN